MANSKCCDASIKGKWGNQSTRIYTCDKCGKNCDVYKTAPPPPPLRNKPL